jgi:drug/metabolite transporter (DMT)-like permease
MGIGIGLAAVVALMTNLASLLKHRGCQHAQPVNIGRPLTSLRSLAASPWFAAGWGLAALAWLAHVAALSLAPISLVQAVLAGGAVTLAVLSQRLFGEPVERRQWLALGLGGAGLALLAATLPHFNGAQSSFSLSAIVSFEGGLVLLAAGVALGHRAERLAARRGVLLAVLAGPSRWPGSRSRPSPAMPAAGRSSARCSSSPLPAVDSLSGRRSPPFKKEARSRRSA